MREGKDDKRPDRAIVNKEHSLAILGEVFDVEMALRRILKNLARQVKYVPEAIADINSKNNKPHKRGSVDVETIKNDIEHFIDELSINEIKQFLESKPAKLINAEAIANIIKNSASFSEAKEKINDITPSGNFLSILGEYILAEKVDEEKFLKNLGELVELRNRAGHWHPISEKNIDRTKNLKDSLLSMLKIKVPKSLSEQLSTIQSDYFIKMINRLKEMSESLQPKIQPPKYPWEDIFIFPPYGKK